LEKCEPFSSVGKLATLGLGCLLLTLSSCKRESASRREVPPLMPQKVIGAEGKQTFPHCPDAPYRILQAKDPATGHHRVFLKWHASTSASGSDPEELRYCLYRSEKPGKAKDCPKNYAKCEQVNVVPVSGTRCVDELVKDNSTYYYVALAITSTGTSTTSAEAIAEVPAAEERSPPPPGAESYPSCRISFAPMQTRSR
jgi:hypothetical protein